MVSVDTPEKAGFAGKPSTAQAKLDACRQRLQDGVFPELPDELRVHLLDRLGPDAAERHISAALRASQYFDVVLAERLTRDDGRQRKLAVLPTGELVDRYGRLLAYLAPWYAGGDSDPVPPKNDPRRRTFNLDMIDSGWGVLFLLYPSLPADDTDYRLAVTAADAAWTERRGMWAEFGEGLLLPYEYRACIRLGTPNPADAVDSAFSRTCYDLRTGTNLGPYGYPAAPPSARLWVWRDQQDQAQPAVERFLSTHNTAES